MSRVLLLALAVNGGFGFLLGMGYGAQHSTEMAAISPWHPALGPCIVLLAAANIGFLWYARAERLCANDALRDARRISGERDKLLTQALEIGSGAAFDLIVAKVGRNPWIPVTERLPRLDFPTLVWGDKLNSDDFPHLARLCGCHEKWISEEHYAAGDESEEDLVEQLRRMVGNVTHWLDWTPPSGAEG